MHRFLLIALGVALVLGSLGGAAATVLADEDAAARAPVFGAPYVCVPSLVWRSPELCPSYGPGTTIYRIASIRLPDPLPQLPITEIPQNDAAKDLLPHVYGHVKTTPLNVYRHPLEAALGLPPVRTMLSGDWWLSLDNLVEYEGQQWYEINEEEYVPADAVALAYPSRFQGVTLSEQPQYPFAWVNRWAQPSLAPQGQLNEAVSIDRYQIVTIFAEERRGDEIWYLVGENQWVEQSFTSRVDVNPPPAEVGPGAKWIEVDLFEGTIAAYEGERMVYTTLFSGGRTSSATPPGLYYPWGKMREGKMSNPDVEDGDPAYYYIEDVPWTIYFHEGYSIHAAFWHDAFGFQRSHGCVNLSPLDAKWFFDWSDPYMPEGQDEAYIGPSTPAPWVWVHLDSPFGEAAAP